MDAMLQHCSGLCPSGTGGVACVYGIYPARGQEDSTSTAAILNSEAATARNLEETKYSTVENGGYPYTFPPGRM